MTHNDIILAVLSITVLLLAISHILLVAWAHIHRRGHPPNEPGLHMRDLDLVCAVLRMEQAAKAMKAGDQVLAELLVMRLADCDAVRLRKYITRPELLLHTELAGQE